MSNTQSKQPSEATSKVQQPRRPNETGSISVEAHIRVFDPKTNKTYVEGRA